MQTVARGEERDAAAMSTADLQPLLPTDLVLEDLLGEGKRSRAWRVSYRGRAAVLKLYRPQFIRKYHERYGVCIAEFEYQRNLAFCSVAALRPYTVEPLRVLRTEEGHPSGFVQTIAPGRRLLDVVREIGYLPEEARKAGRFIVEQARRAGIHDLDINDANVHLHRGSDGWLPVIYDFNMMPQHLFPTNILMSLAFKLRLRDRSYRDWRCLRGWDMRGREAALLHTASDSGPAQP